MWIHTTVAAALAVVACLPVTTARGARELQAQVDDGATTSGLESDAVNVVDGVAGGGDAGQAVTAACSGAPVSTGFGLTACSRFYAESKEATWEDCCSKCNADK